MGTVLLLEDIFSLLLPFRLPCTRLGALPPSSPSPLNLISLASYGNHFPQNCVFSGLLHVSAAGTLAEEAGGSLDAIHRKRLYLYSLGNQALVVLAQLSQKDVFSTRSVLPNLCFAGSSWKRTPGSKILITTECLRVRGGSSPRCGLCGLFPGTEVHTGYREHRPWISSRTQVDRTSLSRDKDKAYGTWQQHVNIP